MLLGSYRQSTNRREEKEKAKANRSAVLTRDNISNDIQGTIQDDKQQQQQHISTTNQTF
jgi:hypothetical protein